MWVKPEDHGFINFSHRNTTFHFPPKAKALLREAPKGFDTLEVEHLSAPVPVKELHFCVFFSLGQEGIEGRPATVFGDMRIDFLQDFFIGLFATRKSRASKWKDDQFD